MTGRWHEGLPNDLFKPANTGINGPESAENPRRTVTTIEIENYIALHNVVVHNAFVHCNRPLGQNSLYEEEAKMNPFETQARLGRELFEVNTSTIRKFVELGGEELRKVWEFNQEFAQKLPEVRDIGSFVELQREYGQSVWEGVKSAVQNRGEIVKDAVEQSGGLIRNVFNPATPAEEVTEKEVKEVQQEAA